MSIDPKILTAMEPYLDRVKVAKSSDLVFKDEGVFSFESPESEHGLFVNLSTHQALAEEFVQLDFERTQFGLYFWQKWRRVEVVDEDGETKAKQEKKKPTKMVLGGDDGFLASDTQWEFEKEYAVVVMPDRYRVAYPNAELPARLAEAVESLIQHADSTQLEAVQNVEEDRPVSKYAEALIQLDNGIKIANDPATWKCGDSGMTENLWLNLSTGYIGSGRRNWDGSGGTGAALRHYEATGGLYPLCVKLGTITAEGADVYSYAPDEDGMVIDPYLKQHLAHFGLDMDSLKKTDKTIEEMTIDLNMRFEFDLLQESGRDLVKVCEPGMVGLRNTGNSCYINSVMQMLFSLPEFRARYGTEEMAALIFSRAPSNAARDFTVQMAKLGVALCTEKYIERLKAAMKRADEVEEERVRRVKAQLEEDGAAAGGDDEDVAKPKEKRYLKPDFSIAPRMLRSIIGQGHAEFATQNQQDAHEYFQHVMEKIRRAERADPDLNPPPSLPSLFEFAFEERVECTVSKQVRYKQQGGQNTLELVIDEAQATNRAEVEAFEAEEAAADAAAQAAAAELEATGVDPKLAQSQRKKKKAPALIVPFDTCLASFTQADDLADWVSPVTNERSGASKTTRFRTFPRYLMVKLRRYVVTADWQPRKITARVDVPRELDLEHLRSNGLQDGEVEMPEGGGDPANAPLEPSAEIVASVTGMGFTENAAKRAAVAVKNAGPQQAMNWVLEHMGDADINDPLPAPAAAGASSGGKPPVDPASVQMLQAMGFTERQATIALRNTGGDLERAADYLFSRNGQVEDEDDGADGADGDGDVNMESAEVNDGPGRYKLIGMISHMGINTGSGHYVAHLLRGDKWIIYNDRKVAISEETPFEYGYCYLYQRLE